MLLRSGVLIGSVALSTAALAAPAARADRVLGKADGITVTRSGATLEVRFTPAALAAAKLKPGRQVSVDCAAHPPAPPLAFAGDSGDETQDAFGDAEVGADGVARVTLDGGLDESIGTIDGCDIQRLRRTGAHSSVSTTIARIGLTPAGDVWADESARALEMRDLILRAQGAQGYEPVAALGAGVVALAGPDAAPAAGQVGYWTDGTHATVATLNVAGRRLVTQDLGDGMLRTNVLQQTDPFVVDDAALPPAGAGPTPARDPEEDPGRSPYTAEDPVTPGDGVRASVRGRRLVVRFTAGSAKAFRAVAGRHVVVLCFTRPPRALYPVISFKEYGTPALTRVPRHGGRVAFAMKGAIGDLCLIADDGTMVATVAPTTVGKRWWQDISAILALLAGDTDHLAAPNAGGYYPTADAVAHSRKGSLVAMAGPGATLPIGRVGVWTDGGRHAVVATRSGSGRRFVLEDQGDGMVRTNVFGELSNVWLLLSLDQS